MSKNSGRHVGVMTDKGEERRRKKARLAEYQEYDKILQTLDYQDKRDLSAHLLLTAQYKKNQPPKRPNDKRQRVTENQDTLIIGDYWTAWPLPLTRTFRPKVPRSSSSEIRDHSSTPLHAEIEATLLRKARIKLQSQNPSDVSANEHPPYHITREVTNTVIAKLDRLLHSLGRIKYQQVTSQRARIRQPPSRWDEIIGIAGISECIDSEDTMERIMQRCNKLFQEDIEWQVERTEDDEEEIE
jgi:hypothetical protein